MESPSRAWPLVKRWIDQAANDVTTLPADPAGGERALEALEVTERSVLGALAVHTGGLSIDHGWLRVLGGPALLDWRDAGRRRADRRPRRGRRLLRRRQAGRRGALSRARHARMGGHGDGARRMGALDADRRDRGVLRGPALARVGGRERPARARHRAQGPPAAVHARGPPDRRVHQDARRRWPSCGAPSRSTSGSTSATDAPPPAARAVLPRRRDHALRQARAPTRRRCPTRCRCTPRDRLRQRRRGDRRRARRCSTAAPPRGAAGG